MKLTLPDFRWRALFAVLLLPLRVAQQWGEGWGEALPTFPLSHFLTFAFLLLSLQAHATGTNYAATIAITNTVGTTNGQSLTLYLNGSTNGVVYNWTNINPVGFHQLAATNTAAKSATNLYAKLAHDYTNAAALSYSSSTSVVFQIINNALNITLSTNWGTVVITTNVLTPNADISARRLTVDYLNLGGDERTGWPAGGGTGGGIGTINGLTGSNLLVTLTTNATTPSISATGTNLNFIIPYAGTNSTGLLSSNSFQTFDASQANATNASYTYFSSVLSTATNATGSTGWIQFNDGGPFGSAAGLTYSRSSRFFQLGATTNTQTHTLKFITGITNNDFGGGTIEWDNGSTSVIKISGTVADTAVPSGYVSFTTRSTDGMIERLRLATNGLLVRGTLNSSNLVVTNAITGSNATFSGTISGPGITNSVRAIVTGAGVTANTDGTLTIPSAILNSIATTKGDLLARSATAIDRFPIGPDGTALLADSSQTYGLRYGTLSANATNAIGNSNGTGTNTSFTGNVLTVSPLRVYSSTNSYAAMDFRDTNGFGVNINIYNSANTNAAPVWKINTDALTNGTFNIGSGGSNAVSIDRSTFTTTFGGPVAVPYNNTTNGAANVQKVSDMISAGVNVLAQLGATIPFGGDTDQAIPILPIMDPQSVVSANQITIPARGLLGITETLELTNFPQFVTLKLLLNSTVAWQSSHMMSNSTPTFTASAPASIPVEPGDIVALSVTVDDGGAVHAVSFGATVIFYPQPNLISDAQAYLLTLSANVITSNEFTFTGGTFSGDTAWAPGVNYANTFYVRDTAMMIRGNPERFTASQIGLVCNYTAALQAVGGGIGNGITADGTLFNDYPQALDNSYDFADVVYSRYKKDGSLINFTNLITQITNAYYYPTVSNHLVFNTNEAQSAWGFIDNGTTNYDLMCSLFRLRASRQISEMYTAWGGHTAQATLFTNEVPLIISSLESNLWDSGTGWFKAYGGDVVKHHVMGSAYAVVLNACSSGIADTISANLVAQINSPNLRGGQVRHLLYPEAWENNLFPPGCYQNGATWGIASAWVAQAIKRTNPTAADAFMQSFVEQCRRLGNSAPLECVNATTGFVGSIRYGTTSAMALQYYQTSFNR